jgi:hypothetical protein
VISRTIIAAAIALSGATAFAQSFDVPAELWDRPRTGRAVLDQENLKRAVGAALARPEAQIVIHHGAGQEREVQAEELKSWLAALAIDTRRVILRADASSGAAMRIEVTP